MTEAARLFACAAACGLLTWGAALVLASYRPPRPGPRVRMPSLPRIADPDVSPAPPFFPKAPGPTDSRTLRLVLWLIFGLVGFLSLVGAVGLAVITRVDPEHAAVVNGLLISLLAPSIGALVALLVKVVLILIGRLNGRMSQWMEQMEITAANQLAIGRAEGLAEGKAENLALAIPPDVVAKALSESGFHAPPPGL